MNIKNKIAVYPGTFDPFTYGHLDILKRASKLFDRVIIAVSKSSSKKALFTIDERIKIIKPLTTKIKNVMVESFDGLLVNYVKSKKASVIIRGLRGFSDFEYETQMALTNRKIAEEIETVFLLPSEKYAFISSTLVKEIAANGGVLSDFVPGNAAKMILKKFNLK